MYGYYYDPNDDLWEDAHEWACQRASEEGDVDIDRDYTIMEAYEEEYLCDKEGMSYNA